MADGEQPPGSPAPTPPAALEYPCAFPIKVVGRGESGLAREVVAIVMRHAPDFDDATLEMKPSKQGKYLGLTCIVNATSREQLDALYRDLCDHPGVVMVL